MLRRLRRCGTLCAIGVAGSLSFTASAQAAEKIFAVTATNDLITFQSDAFSTVTPIAAISGLGLGEDVVGMDEQPSTGRIFVVTDTSRIYTLDKVTAAATPVGGAFTPLLAGTQFGIDFNPVVNAIRLVSDTAQNLRVSPTTGQVTNTDTALSTTDVSAAAYTNNTAGANSTTLLDLDADAGTLYRQGGPGGLPSPNAGQLTTIATTVNGVDNQASLDVSGATNVLYAVVTTTTGGTSNFGTINPENGSSSFGPIGAAPTSVVAMTVDAQPPSTQFANGGQFAASETSANGTVTITRTGNLDSSSTIQFQTTATGTAVAGADFSPVAATTVTFPAGSGSQTAQIPLFQDGEADGTKTVGFSVTGASGSAVGAPNTGTLTIFDDDGSAPNGGDPEKIFGLTAAGNLVTFTSAAPGTVTTIGPVTGLALSQSLVGIDIQPRTGRLFGVSTDSKIYTIDKATAAATQVGSAAFSPLLTGGDFGVDFNPVANALRVISTNGQNLRLSPDTGLHLAGGTGPGGGDANLTGAADPAAAAYTNSVNGASSTTLYVIDQDSSVLMRQGGLGGTPSPNGGVLTTVGSLGLSPDNTSIGFDISGATNTAYASFQTVVGAATLHRIDLSTGAAGDPAPIGAANVDLIGLAVDAQPPTVQFSGAAYAAGENAGTAAVTINRTGNTGSASTVSFATNTAGSASAGSDFTAVAATTVTFAAGETTKTVSIPVADDTAVEDPETIGVAITGPTGASLGAPNTATVTVFDNDPATVPGPAAPGPGPAPTPGPDTTRPVLLVVPPTPVRRASFGTRGLPVPFSCNETCSVVGTLRFGSRTLGTGTNRLTGAAFGTLRVRLSTSGRTFLNTRLPAGRRFIRRSVLATLTTVATDAAGNRISLAKRILIRR